MILDIETTGLSPTYTEVILVGIIYHKEDQWHLTQLYCDHRSEEKELLLALKTYIDDHMMITYNGHAFDIPYLNKRFKAHDIDYSIDLHKNFDLYRVIRASKKALGLDNYKLKSIEEYLGIYREDQISGKESVDLYNQYELEASLDLRDKILLHNSDDIEYMIPTFAILNHIPEDIISKYYPFIHYSNDYGELICRNYLLEQDYITTEWQYAFAHDPFVDYDDGYVLSVSNQVITIKLPLFHIGERHFIDVDQLQFLGLTFNEMSYPKQVEYELKTKKDNLMIVLKILEKHHL